MHVVGVVIIVILFAGHRRGRDNTCSGSDGNEFLAEFVERGLILFVVALTRQRCWIFSPLGRQYDVDEGADEHEGRGEGVDPDVRERHRRMVAAHEFYTEPTDTVRSDVQREQPAVAELELTISPDQQREND